MPSLDDVLQQKLQLLDAKHARRYMRVCEPQDGAYVLREGKKLLSFSSNNYLGLAHHAEVIQAARAALESYGAGAGASRLVTGNHPLYRELETALAEYKGTEAALVFGSGYLANIGAITALVGKPDLILADKLVHACMVDAAQLSGATFLRFAHNNLDHCRILLESYRSEHQHCLILTETIFSMDGDKAPLAGLAHLAQGYDAWLMTDDAHGIPHPVGGRPGGGPNGNTAISDAPTLTLPLQGRENIHMGTLSKAIGSYGGYVCGSQTLIDYLVNAARSLVYSTGLPPASIAAGIASLAVMKREPERCALPVMRARQFTEALGLPDPQSAIVPLIMGMSEKALEAQAALENEGILAIAIRPPTVPAGKARLRFAFTALHTEADVARAAEAVMKHGLHIGEEISA